MKLSKAQQEVVDKMRDGWYYCLIGNDSPQMLVFRLAFSKTIVGMHKGIFKSLLHKGIIERTTYDGFTAEYRLTEQYKTVVLSNEQAAQYAERARKEVIERTGLPTSEIVRQSIIKTKRNDL